MFYNLKDLINKLENKISCQLTEDKLPERRGKNNKSVNYLYKDINNLIKDRLSDLDLPSLVIQVPNLPGVDYTIDVKGIFDLNKDRFNNIKEVSDYIYSKLKKLDIDDNLIRTIEQKGIFVNIYLDEDTTLKILKDTYQANIYGEDNLLDGKKSIVDYSSPNIAKQMSVGHFRATIQGQVISNILQILGSDVIRWNYIGDWGTPFGKLIYTFLILYFDYEKLPIDIRKKAEEDIGMGEIMLENLYKDPIDILGKVYAFFNEIPFEDKYEKARYYFKLLSEGDKDILKLWNIFRCLSLEEFNQVYKLLNVKFDVILGEAFAEKYVNKVIEDLKKFGYLTISQGAEVVFFKKVGNDYIPLKKEEVANYKEDELEPLLIRKKDGTTLYATRDLATLYVRGKLLKATDIYYVVGREQSLHFRLVFKLADKLGYIRENNLYHISFGLLLLGGKKMSSRSGKIVKIVDLLNLVKEKIISDFGDRISEEDAMKLAISAIMINDLKNDRIKDINFDLNKMTKLDGDSGVYLQYGWVRLNSLLEKIENQLNSQIDRNDFSIKLFTEKEIKIIKKMGYYPIILLNSYELMKPNLIVSYLFELMKDFNSWYTNSPKIVDLSEEEKLNKYIFLKQLKKVFYSIFSVLNLPFVKRM